MKEENKKPPTIITIPNTSEKKMEAIVNLSKAIKSLSIALTSTNIKVLVENCEFSSEGQSTGLNIKTEEI